MQPTVVFAVLVPLLAWRIYKRVRRNIGRQRSRLWRHWAGTVLCPLLLTLIALGAMRSMDAERKTYRAGVCHLKSDASGSSRRLIQSQFANRPMGRLRHR